MHPSALRLFVAIEPSLPVRESLTALATGCARANWVPGPQLHLTLRFIGEVSPELEPQIVAALQGVRVQPFLLGVEGVGRFPPRGAPGVVWAGIGAGHPLLHQLRQQVDDRLLATGVPLELRSFSPHLTLARTREASPGAVEQWLKRHREFHGPTWRVEAFHLMATTLTLGGAEHQVRATFPLGDRSTDALM